MVWIGDSTNVTLNFSIDRRPRETMEMANRLSSCFALAYWKKRKS